MKKCVALTIVVLLALCVFGPAGLLLGGVALGVALLAGAVLASLGLLLTALLATPLLLLLMLAAPLLLVVLVPLGLIYLFAPDWLNSKTAPL